MMIATRRSPTIFIRFYILIDGEPAAICRRHRGCYGRPDPRSTITVTELSEILDHTHIETAADTKMLSAAARLTTTARSSRDCM